MSQFSLAGVAGYTLGYFLVKLEKMGAFSPNNFKEHLGSFIEKCIITYNSLCEEDRPRRKNKRRKKQGVEKILKKSIKG